MGSGSFCREGWMRVCFVFCILYFVFCGKIQMKIGDGDEVGSDE